MKRVWLIAIPALLLILFIAAVFATRYYLQKNRESVAEQIRIESDDEFYRGALYITVDGKEKKISDRAFRHYLHNGGREVIYVGAEDNRDERFSVRVYNVKTETTFKALFTDIPHLSALGKDVTLADGKRLMVMETGADIGAPQHLWVIDPERGAIFFQPSAVGVKTEDALLTVAYFRDEDWEKMKGDVEVNFTDLDYLRKKAKVKPYKIEKIDLEKIRGNEVIEPEKQIALGRSSALSTNQ